MAKRTHKSSRTKQAATTRKRPVSVNDVVLAMLTPSQGLEHVKKMQPEPSKGVLTRSAFSLKNRGAEGAGNELWQYVTGRYPLMADSRRPLELGASKVFRISKQGENDLHLRIPVRKLKGAAHGGKVLVELNAEGTGGTFTMMPSNGVQ